LRREIEHRWHEWRKWWWHHKRHHHRDKDFVSFLELDKEYTVSGSNLSITLGDGLGHAATLACLNLDGTTATGVTVTYSSDTPAVCTVDPNTGVLGPLTAGGPVTITGTGVRGGFTHSDTGIVTVIANDSTGDFTAALGLQ
jgi:uncharacterized protein YjdB